MSKFAWIGLVLMIASPSFAGIKSGARKVSQVEIDGKSFGSDWRFDSPRVYNGWGCLRYDETGKSTKVTAGLLGLGSSSWEFANRDEYHCKSKQTQARDSFQQLIGQVETRLKAHPDPKWQYLPELGMKFDVEETKSVVSPYVGTLTLHTKMPYDSDGDHFEVAIKHVVTYAQQDAKWVLKKAHVTFVAVVGGSPQSIEFVRQETVGKESDMKVNDGSPWSKVLGGE